MKKIRTICVLGCCSSIVGDKYKEHAAKIGELLAHRHYRILYVGLSNLVAKACDKAGGTVLALYPENSTDVEEFGPNTEIIKLKDMAECSKFMLMEADIFLVLPGSMATLEKLFEILNSNYLGKINTKTIIYSQDNFWQELESMLEKLVEYGFLKFKAEKSFKFVHQIPQIIETLDDMEFGDWPGV